MKLKEIIALIASLLFLSNVSIGLQAQSNIKSYWQRGSLKVDTTFKKMYLGNFLVPYTKFTDLHHCKIRIKTKKLKTTMTARPGFWSLLMGKKNRQYIIHINIDPKFEGVLLTDVPEEARIGLFAHELMHIRDYESRKVAGVVKRGFQYLSKKGKREVEHYTDSLTIAAGFGEHLFQWAAYVLYDSDASEEYKAFKNEIYMSPATIYSKMNMLE